MGMQTTAESRYMFSLLSSVELNLVTARFVIPIRLHREI